VVAPSKLEVTHESDQKTERVNSSLSVLQPSLQNLHPRFKSGRRLQFFVSTFPSIESTVLNPRKRSRSSELYDRLHGDEQAKMLLRQRLEIVSFVESNPGRILRIDDDGGGPDRLACRAPVPGPIPGTLLYGTASNRTPRASRRPNLEERQG